MEIRTYGYALGSEWTTAPLFQKEGSEYYWYLNDHLGTPQKAIDSNGITVWSGTYDSFGNAHVDTELIINNLRLPGQYYDQETGLHYNFNRYHDPKIGRYLRVDPAGDGLNLYAYVRNNPLRYVDPQGLRANPLSSNINYEFERMDRWQQSIIDPVFNEPSQVGWAQLYRAHQ